MYQYLVKTIDRLANEYWLEDMSPWDTARRFKALVSRWGLVHGRETNHRTGEGRISRPSEGHRDRLRGLADAKRLMNDMFGPTQSRRITMNSVHLSNGLRQAGGEGINIDSQLSSGKGIRRLSRVRNTGAAINAAAPSSRKESIMEQIFTPKQTLRQPFALRSARSGTKGCA